MWSKTKVLDKLKSQQITKVFRIHPEVNWPLNIKAGV